jgi:hypothetical protein
MSDLSDTTILRLLPTDLPPAYLILSDEEKAWRGRAFLMTWALGGSVAMAWVTALHDDPEHVADLKGLAAEADDNVIRDAVAARRNAEALSSSLSAADLR